MAELNDDWRSFLQGRRIATFATRNADDALHLTAVWYLFEDDAFYLAVSSHSRKWKNSIAHPQVSLGGGYDYARPNPRIFPRADRWDDSWDASVNLTWSLWDGGRRGRRRRRRSCAPG